MRRPRDTPIGSNSTNSAGTLSVDSMASGDSNSIVVGPFKSPSPSRRQQQLNQNKNKSSTIASLVVVSLLALVATLLTNPRENLESFNKSLLFEQQQEQSDDDGEMVRFQRYSKSAPICSEITSKDDIAFTLVTQTSMNRLWLMKHHCELWSGPISMAVLVENDSASKSATSTTSSASSIQNDLRTKYGCKPNQVTVSILDKQGFSEDDYPVNHLRNLALSGVKTTHIMYIDIDFWPSANLYDTLHNNTSTIKDEFMKDSKLALVMPAFQLENGICSLGSKEKCSERDINSMPKTKKDLMPLLTQEVILRQKGKWKDIDKRVTPFRLKVFPQGHNSTNYDIWYNKQLTPGDLHTLPCVQSGVYEPYLAVRYCKDTPPFQEVFTGYGQNKATWILQLRNEGYLFRQVGGVFVIHFPHEDSKAKEVWKKHPKEIEHFWIDPVGKENVTDSKLQQFKRGQMDKALLDFRSWLVDSDDRTSPSHGLQPNEIATRERFGRCKDWVDQDYRLWVVDDKEKGRLSQQHSRRVRR